MATVGRANNASYLNTARLSYISTAPFQNNIFYYTTSIVQSTGNTVGTLTPWSNSVTASPPGAGSTAATCPAGRVLRETGRKLYPGANPNVNTYMVSVYDQQTQLTGFIDPNSSVWCIYNTDKPNFWPDGVDPTTQVTDAGLSIYTLGNVTANGFISTASYLTVAGNALVVGNTSTLGNELVAGNLSTIGSIAGGANITARTYISSGTSMSAFTTATAGKFNASVIASGTSAGSASAGVASLNGTVGVTITTTACTANSIIIATIQNPGDAGTGIAVNPGAGSFTAWAAAGKTNVFYWMIIN